MDGSMEEISHNLQDFCTVNTDLPWLDLKLFVARLRLTVVRLENTSGKIEINRGKV